jgi:hypothetical protein
MRCKTPIIFANNSSLPEVVGEGGCSWSLWPWRYRM